MTIVRIEREDEIVLAAQDGFDAGDADALRELLLQLEGGRPVTVDFRAVRGMEDFVMARVAPALSRASVHVLGLSDHQRRILRYVSAEPAAQRAGAPEKLPPADD